MNRLALAPLALLATPVLGALLYDPASGQIPNAYTPNPWSYGQITFPATISTTVTAPVTANINGGLLQFDTTGGTVRAGWSSTGGTMDRSTGYTISFDLQVVSESHGSTDRAGFSVIALSSDLQGIELGFWGNEVWAQNTAFTHGEGTTGFNPAAALVSYDLTVQGSSYTLKANDTQILTGTLRNYSGGGFPYTSPNLIFIGDDTFSANANVDLGAINYVAVPEPETIALWMGIGLLGWAGYRRKLRQAASNLSPT